jgi:hypothetical protein
MSARREKNYLWVCFFVFIILASVGVACFMIWFNNRMQLKPEQLEAARQRWKQDGPGDYRLTISKRINEQDLVETFVVTVRDRKVIDVRLNGERLRDEDNQPFPPGHERLQYYSMEYLMRDIEVFLDQDAKAGVKNYNVAIFDEKTGGLRKYVRRVMGTRQRVEEDVKIEPLPN